MKPTVVMCLAMIQPAFGPMPRPVLSIAPMPGAVQLSWSADYTNYLVQARDSLHAPWRTISENLTPIGDVYQFTVTNDSAQQYFRLERNRRESLP